VGREPARASELPRELLDALHLGGQEPAELGREVGKPAVVVLREGPGRMEDLLALGDLVDAVAAPERRKRDRPRPTLR
jgi:hypothetical protein